MERKEVNPNFIMDEAFKELQALQKTLVIKSAYIRQLEDRIKVLEAEKSETDKEETL